MNTLPVIVFALVSAHVLGCAPHLQAAPRHSLVLGPHTAVIRDYSQFEVCREEGRVLALELEDAQSLLTRFVEATRRPPSGAPWTDEQLLRFEEAARVLPNALRYLEHTHRNLGRCNFDEGLGLTALVRQGRRVISETKARLKQGHDVLKAHRHSVALRDWEETFQREQAVLRGQRCQGKELKVFQAGEHADGSREYVFCDGARLTSHSDGTLELQTPTGRKASSVPEADYHDAAARFPPSEMSHAPKEHPRGD